MSTTKGEKFVTYLLAAYLLVAGIKVRAEQEQLVSVSVEGVEGQLRDNVLAHLQIIQAGEKLSEPSAIGWLSERIKQLGQDRQPPILLRLKVTASRLQWLHGRADTDIREALKPFGYYQPSIESSLQPEPPNGWQARYRIDPGPPLRIGRLDLRIMGEGSDDAAFDQLLEDSSLARGAVLFQPDYETLKQQLERVATQRGYFDARLTTQQIRIDLQANSAEVILWFDTGIRYHFGDVRFPDIALSPRFLQRYLKLRPGDAYASKALLRLQSDLINSGYFRQVAVTAPRQKAEDYRIPIDIELKMRNRRQFLSGLGYATDTGIRGRLGYRYHWLNDAGHRLNLELRASRIKYGLGASYDIPGTDPSTDLYSLHAKYAREDSDVKDTTTYVIGGRWKQQLGLLWERHLSLNYGLEEYRDDDEKTSQLLIPGISFIRLAVDDPLNVTHGSRLELKLLGAHQNLLSDVTLLQPRINAKLVWSFAPRHRLIGRADLGTTSVSNFAKLPSSLRFYAGGDNSVRGYDLDKISPVNAHGDEVGGKHLIVGSLEYEYRLFDKWGIAAFVDAGDAFNDDPDMKTGIGLGVRWYTLIGPVRVDIAHALERTPGDTIRLHISIGPEL